MAKAGVRQEALSERQNSDTICQENANVAHNEGLQAILHKNEKHNRTGQDIHLYSDKTMETADGLVPPQPPPTTSACRQFLCTVMVMSLPTGRDSSSQIQRELAANSLQLSGLSGISSPASWGWRVHQ